MTEPLNALAANIVSRHKTGADPYILFLGAGASISSGCSSMLAIAEDLLSSHDPSQLNVWESEIAQAEELNATFGNLQRQETNVKKVARFLEIWGTLDSDSRYVFLRKHLLDGKTPSQGYADLASLIQARFFTTILTTNLDTLMEKALQGAGLLQPEDFIVIVNGKDSPAEVADQLESSRSPIRIVKLHGTLESPRSYAFTPEEIFGFEKSIRPSLVRIVNQSLIVVGHSMQDRDINTLFEEDGKEIHFVNPAAPQRGSSIENVLAVRGLGSVISGADGSFDGFCGKLRKEVERLSKESLKSNSGSSIEVFLRGLGLEAELKAPRSRYKNLETLYVKPTEYDEIVSKLENDHLVFIIGEPHMGKTYTALYLLWQYHQKGYETIHIRHDRLINLLHRHDDNLKELLLELFTPESHRSRIVHFDDPFGETSERRTEVIANRLNMFLQMAKSYEHLRVTVTSRLNIFNEALSDRSDNELQSFEKTLRVHTSYKREVLLDILHRYVSFYKPAWANDKKITAELDEKLPLMLPAPHNIEFFVNTSETLNSIDAVLAHVEESKKMISALAGWMKHMPPHEQIFLMWVEICSTAGILFPGTGASEIDIERAFKENLAYLFSEGHLPGIPTMPFHSARDKFESILIERRDDGGSGVRRLDFVHPSYHEAFWYAINQKFPMAQWWDVLTNKIENVLRDSSKSLDLVQLKMIERYGTVNRDLDQLLLMSATSKDPNEQLIALEHMLDRLDRFVMLPQFTSCVSSIVSQKSPAILLEFLGLYEKYFDKLPPDVLRSGFPFLFHADQRIRLTAQHTIISRTNVLTSALRDELPLKQWRTVAKLIRSKGEDPLESLSVWQYDPAEHKFVIETVVTLSSDEIAHLAQIRSEWLSRMIFSIFHQAWSAFSAEQRQAIGLGKTVVGDDDDLRSRIEAFIAVHPTDFIHLEDEYSVIRSVVKLGRAFSLPQDENINVSLTNLPITEWPSLSATLIREFSSVSSLNLGSLFTTRILEGYEEFSQEKGDAYLDALYQPSTVPSLIDYVEDHIEYTSNLPRSFSKLSEPVLLRLLNATGRVQYEFLTSLFLRLHSLSLTGYEAVDALIRNPPDWWVAASAGQLCMERYARRLEKRAQNIPWEIANLKQEKLRGSLLAELGQAFLDRDIGLQEKYEPLMRELLKDSKASKWAEKWMDHLYQSFDFKDPAYWSDIKGRFHRLLSQ